MVILDIILQCSAEITKGGEVVCLEEWVGGSCKSDFLIIYLKGEVLWKVNEEEEHTESSGLMSGTIRKSTLPF